MSKKDKPTYDPSQWPWVRECQECGHKQIAKDPATYKGDSWKDLKCKACGSDSLDYGSKQPWTDLQKAEYQAWEDWENAQDNPAFVERKL